MYLQGYLYFSLGTTYHHHLLSPGISQHNPSWNLGIYFPTHLLAPNITIISGRGIFYKLKSCLISPNHFQMDSHGSWDKEAKFQHCLLALQDPDPPGPWGDYKVTKEEPFGLTVPFLLP